MQFKKMDSGTVQVIRYEGYDREKRRSITKVIGCLQSDTLEPTDDLINKLTVDEKNELQEYRKNALLEASKNERLSITKYIYSHMEKAAHCIAEREYLDREGKALITVDQEFVRQAVDAIKRLSKALKATGLVTREKGKKAEKSDAPLIFKEPEASNQENQSGE